jgi:hypothetical protein
MLNRMKRLGSTGLGGEKSHELSASNRAPQRLRNGAGTFAAVRNHQPDSNLAFENHSPPRSDLQAAVRRCSRVRNSGADMKYLSGGRENPGANAYNETHAIPRRRISCTDGSALDVENPAEQ